MDTYTLTEARQKLSFILDRAKKKGKVFIQRKDGSVFEVKALSDKKSPLDVKGINIEISRDEIIKAIKESRRK